jgi:hypothetical protein
MLINRDAVTSFEPYFNRKIVLQLKVKLTDKAIVSRLKVGRLLIVDHLIYRGGHSSSLAHVLIRVH